MFRFQGLLPRALNGANGSLSSFERRRLHSYMIPRYDPSANSDTDYMELRSEQRWPYVIQVPDRIAPGKGPAVFTNVD